MTRLVDVVAARLIEGSLAPYLGPWIHRTPPYPPGPDELAAWLGRLVPEAAAVGDLAAVTRQVERLRGRRGLARLLREAYSPRAEPSPLHLLLAGLPRLPLAVSAFLDGSLLDVLRAQALAGGRSLAMVHGLAPGDARGVFFAEAEGEGLVAAASADTVLYQPLGTPAPAPSFLVTEVDVADALLALDTQAPIPPEVQRRRRGSGFLFAGCRLEAPVERLYARAVLRGASGPHFAVLPGPPGRGVEAFAAAEGVTLLELSQERFVAELSRRLAMDDDGWTARL